jgi:POT family proton-dependent oligopeptide transporter
VAGHYDENNEAPFFIRVGLASVVTGVVMMLASRPIHTLMAGVD